MGRTATEKTCCVCLAQGAHFNKLTRKDGKNVSLLTKFRMCIAEVIWLPMYYLCPECTEILNSVHLFRDKCIKSDIIRKAPKFKDEPEVRVTKYERPGYVNLQNDTIKKFDREEKPEAVPEDNFEDTIYSSDNEQENDKSESNSDTEEESPRTSSQGVARRPRKIKFTCEHCDKCFSNSNKLRSHCIKDHAMKLKEIKPFSCDRCPQRFSTSSNLWQHLKYHEGVKSHMCSYCGQGFITKNDLINHEKKHLNMREYNCEFCGKSFNTHKDIRSHRLIVHTDSSNWKYRCEICNKSFPIKTNYDCHMKRHLGEKQFACHLCEKRFTTKCDLQRHTRSHSDVREYKCMNCDKEYKDERVLKVHMAKIHGIGVGKVKVPIRERNYACQLCPKAFYAKNKLVRHLYTHSGEKPFDCPMCDKKFNDKSYVKQHLRNTHNVESDAPIERPSKKSYLLIAASDGIMV
ncbi:unnamed protein product [Ceutorhynchus assimilis]|uniref:C2H2-type domain-containing protein n=1 Tax=Ceutorhynchus assimilis TaxID=467358 RepID=A0A9N9QH43_9CUCU|nr:unnamed protein product [Ceutorhynchus assimilis]